MLKKLILAITLVFLSGCMQTQVRFAGYIPSEPTYSKFHHYRGNDVDPVRICGRLDNIAMVEETENFISALVRTILFDLWQPTYVNVYCKQDPEKLGDNSTKKINN
ncbi:MAG: Bor family protein [Alphaproteobacteria bacterium]|nr:Bor family protein [Alphaproteobacteria bacterium]